MIAIKGNMPTCCRDCPLCHDAACYARGYRDDDIGNGLNRRNDCPLIELPEDCSTCKHYSGHDRNYCVECTDDNSRWEPMERGKNHDHISQALCVFNAEQPDGTEVRRADQGKR